MKSIARRKILKAVAAAPATLTIRGARDKSGLSVRLMGSGEFTY
jgi:hypothetical protein